MTPRTHRTLRRLRGLCSARVSRLGLAWLVLDDATGEPLGAGVRRVEALHVALATVRRVRRG